MGKSRRHCIVYYKGVTVLAVLLLLFSCKDEDYIYPAVKTDFVSVTTNSAGRVDSLLDDDGGKYALSLSQNGLTPDSLYRCVSRYAVTGNSIQLYTLQNIVSPDPVVYKTVKTDAVSSVRIWRGSGYINMIVKTLGQSKAHRWGLHQEKAVMDKGHLYLYFTLYHDMNGDYPAFSRATYLSFPLRKYAGYIQRGDSIFVTVNQTVSDKDTRIVYPLVY